MRNVFLLLFSALFISACGGGSTQPPKPVANKAPSLALENQSVYEGQQVSILATANDSDGRIVSYQWTQTAGQSVTFSGEDQAQIQFDAPATSSDTTLVFEVTVTDDDGAASKEQVEVVVSFNAAPVVDLSVEKDEFYEAQSAVIFLTAEDDSGEIVKVDWQQVSGPEVEQWSASSQSLTFVAPNIDAASEAQFKVTVTDSFGKSTEQVVTLMFVRDDFFFTLNGITPYARFYNGTARLTIGSTVHDAAIDDDGRFSFSVNTSVLNTEVRVEVVVSGADEADRVQLARSMGTIDVLLERFDDRLAQSNRLDFVVDEFTTAIYGQLNNRSVVSNTKQRSGLGSAKLSPPLPAYSSYRQLLNSMSAPELDIVARFIKVLVLEEDAHAFETISPEYSTVLELLEADKNAYRLAQKYKNEHLSRFLAATAPLSNADFTQLSEAETLLLTTDFDQINNDKLARLRFSPDNTGSLVFATDYSITERVSFSWNNAGDGIVTSNINPNSMTFHEFCQQGMSADKCYQTINSIAVYRWHVASGMNLVALEFGIQESPDSGSAMEYEYTHRQVYWQIEKNDLVSVSEAVPLNQPIYVDTPTLRKLISLENYNVNSYAQAGRLELAGTYAEGGSFIFDYITATESGGFQDTTLNGTWQLNGDGLDLDFTNSELIHTANMLFYTRGTTNMQVAFTSRLDGYSEPTLTGGNVSVKDYTQSSLMDDYVGIYTYPFNRYGTDAWYELDINGEAHYRFVSDADANGTITADEVKKIPGLWKLSEDGKLIIRRYALRQGASIGEYCSPTAFYPAAGDTCILRRELELDFLSQTSLLNGETNLSYYSLSKDFYNNFYSGDDFDGVDTLSRVSSALGSFQRVSVPPVDISSFD